MHLLIGVAGLAAYRNFEAAKAYALTVGVTWWDHVLHILTAVVAFGAYFASQGTAGMASASR